jgi:hypothetical protein
MAIKSNGKGGKRGRAGRCGERDKAVESVRGVGRRIAGKRLWGKRLRCGWREEVEEGRRRANGGKVLIFFEEFRWYLGRNGTLVS